MSLKMYREAYSLRRDKEQCTDLTAWKPDQTIDYFDKLTATGEIVLHGTPRSQVGVFLEPRLAFDSSSEIGRQKAVYATSSAPQALFCAIYDKFMAHDDAAHRDVLSIVGFSTDNWRCEFRFMPQLLEGIVRGDPDFINDGFVYAIPRDESFTQHPDRSYEWLTGRAIFGPLRFRVSRSIGEVLFGASSNLFPDRFGCRAYTEEEYARHQQTLRSVKRTPSDLRRVYGRFYVESALRDLGLR